MGDFQSPVLPPAHSPLKTPRVSAKRRNPFGEISPIQMKTFVQDVPPAQEIYARTHDMMMKAAREGSAWTQPAASATLAAARLSDMAQCWVCRQEAPCVTCAFCDKSACNSCLQQCERCQNTFCSFCSTPNYDRPWDRMFCLSCNEAESRAVSKFNHSSPPQSMMVGFSAHQHMDHHQQQMQQMQLQYEQQQQQQQQQQQYLVMAEGHEHGAGAF